MIQPFTLNYQINLCLQCRLVVIEITQTNLDELIVVFLLGESWRKFHTDIVLGEAMHSLASWRLLEEHLSLGTDILGIELLGLLVAQLQQTLRAHLLLLLAYHVWNLQGSCSWTLGIWEHMELRNRQTLQELIAFLKALRSFTTTAHHHIYTDKGIRHLLLDQVHLMGEERLVVTAVHQLQHLIASALQGNMEVRHEGTALGTIGNEVVITEDLVPDWRYDNA